MTVVGQVIIKNNFKALGKTLEKEIEKRFDLAAEQLKTEVQRGLKTSNRMGLNPSQPGDAPHRGVSGLMNSIFWDTRGPMYRVVGTRLVYGLIQEIGGTITSSKWMPIPVSDEAKRHRSRGGNAREFPKKLRWIRRAGRPPLLVQEIRGSKKAGRRSIVHYVLKKSVRLPPRPFLRPAAESSRFRNKLNKIFAKLA